MYEKQVANSYGTGIGGAVTWANSEAPRELGALDMAMGSAESGLAELDHALNVLSGQLESVMRPIPPQLAGNGTNLAAAPAPHSPLTERLFRIRERTEMLTNAVNSLRARLEV